MAKITIKTKQEIALLREGGKRHAQILRELRTIVRPGVSTAELDKRAYELVMQGGDTPSFLNYKPAGAKKAFLASLCVSVNDQVVHGIPSEDRVLKDGDIVTIDLGLIHGGMFTDAAITVPVGEVAARTTELLQATEEALAAGIRAARGGGRIGDIGEAIERVAVAHKLGLVEELSGHGVGYSVHEEPFVPNYGVSGKGERLVPGMVLALEPIFTLGDGGVYLDKTDGYTYYTTDGSYAAHSEHTIVITDGQPEVLTS